MKVRVKQGRRHNGLGPKNELVTYEAGDTCEVSDGQYQSFKDKLEPLEGEVVPPSTDDSKFDVKKADVDALLEKAAELELDTEELKDEGELRDAVAKALKKAGKGKK